jgi:hypothetical protein
LSRFRQRTSELLPAPERPMMPNTSPGRDFQIDAAQGVHRALGPWYVRDKSRISIMKNTANHA